MSCTETAEQIEMLFFGGGADSHGSEELTVMFLRVFGTLMTCVELTMSTAGFV